MAVLQGLVGTAIAHLMFELPAHQQAAEALDIAVPAALRARADEVIE
jgi:hypothetical protein